jgi:hypothetical protein
MPEPATRICQLWLRHLGQTPKSTAMPISTYKSDPLEIAKRSGVLTGWSQLMATLENALREVCIFVIYYFFSFHVQIVYFLRNLNINLLSMSSYS